MEIYNFYNSWAITLYQMGADGLQERLIGLFIGFAIWAALFTLQGFGLYKMAKNRNIKNKWMAFVPFLNVWFIGKLAGECDIFGRKMKRAGLYAMLATILTLLMYASIIGAELYLYAVEGVPGEYRMNQMTMDIVPFWTNMSQTSSSIYAYYELACAYIVPIFQLVFEILMFILLMGLYKKYYPKNYILISLLALFIPMSRYIVIFVLRNRTAIDYEAYVRARREAYMRQQQQYQNRYGNPYNQNPYTQNPYNQNSYNRDPYGNANQNTNPSPKPEDPFEEFSSEKKSDGENGQNGGSGNSGDFFN